MTGLLRAPLVLLVLFYQSAILALAQVWANKMRSLLTTLGIVIGVTSVSTIIAALSGLQKTVVDRLESFGTNNMFIFPDRPDTGTKRRLTNNAIFFKPVRGLDRGAAWNAAAREGGALSFEDAIAYALDEPCA